MFVYNTKNYTYTECTPVQAHTHTYKHIYTQNALKSKSKFQKIGGILSVLPC